MKRYTVLHLFSGLGGGALGFQRSRARHRGVEASFETLAGIDFNEAACQDFRSLTGAPVTVGDLSTMTVEELKAATADRAPDVVFTSPPCKGFSGLLSTARSKEDHYQALNRLVFQGLWLVLEAWPESPPKLIVLENVPRIQSRGAELLRQLRDLLSRYGYVFHEGTHECGEVGGLAQRRTRYLLVARHERQVPVFVYQPPKKPLRTIGEVLAALPLPDDPDAGRMHRLPRLQWKTWVRLALIPAGGDWRSLGRKRDGPWRGQYGVVRWTEELGTVTGNGRPGAGAFTVTDPRLPDGRYNNVYRVVRWDDSSVAVTGGGTPTSGGVCVADPRIGGKGSRPDLLGVLRLNGQAKTISGHASVSGSNCPAAVADPRIPLDNDRPDPPPVIVALDGTWHRPLTTLELAALQGLPVDAGIEYAGNSHAGWRERIGNAVPPPAAQAVGESLLQALLAADAGASFTLGGTDIWVQDEASA